MFGCIDDVLVIVFLLVFFPFFLFTVSYTYFPFFIYILLPLLRPSLC